MEWVTALSNTIQYIEAHLLENLTLSEIAEQVYLSPLYLQKGFQILSGSTISEYIRNRRLSLAAEEILSTDIKIIDAAYKYGYDTPESFTKAFTRFHGISPAQIRKANAKPVVYLPLKINLSIQGGNSMQDLHFTVSPMFPFKIIGFARDFDYETAYAEIPKFWDEICEKYANPLYETMQPKNPFEQAIMDNCIGEYGVCIDDIGDGKFRYLIGGKYTGGEVPEGMTLVEIPYFQWAKFKTFGPMPDALQTLNTEVFRSWLPNNPDYEIAAPLNIEWYSCDGEKSDADYESAIWVPVKKKE